MAIRNAAHERLTPRRNAFEVDNARNQTLREITATFIPTRTFRRCLSAKHHIVIGSRGSGKTIVARVLAHDHLARLEDAQARDIVRSKAYIGTYVPMRLEWTSALRSKPWRSLSDKEQLFQWRLNVATVLGFLVTVRSCLDVYIADEVDRAKCEVEFVKRVAESWVGRRITLPRRSLKALAAAIRDQEYRDLVSLASERIHGSGELISVVSPELCIELFAPMQYGMRALSDLVGCDDDTRWLLCLDEAEFLDEDYHRILNSHLRAYSERLFFKITTMPYRHYTLDTNSGAHLNQGEDFDYVYLDQDPLFNMDELSAERRDGGSALAFARLMFRKRSELAQENYGQLELRQIFGSSSLLLPAKQGEAAKREFVAKLAQHCTTQTIERATRLLKEAEGTDLPEDKGKALRRFEDAIERKLRGAILLREEVARIKGHRRLRVYSGEEMIVRCSDGNPRRLVRAFNHMLQQARTPRNGAQLVRVNDATQNAVLKSLGELALARAQTEQDVGDRLHQIIHGIGVYCYDALHKQKLSTDVVSSGGISEFMFARYGDVIKRAVGRDLLYPNRTGPLEEGLPAGEASFRLAYVMAPYFKILPRRGRTNSLSVMLRYAHRGDRSAERLPLFDSIGEGEDGAR